MEKQLKAVAEFHKAFGQQDGKWPQNLSEPEAILRYKLMAEENEEYLEACAKNSLVDIADALGD
jgi:predicted HAD superfamily Cof-like phosphohydrolase